MVADAVEGEEDAAAEDTADAIAAADLQTTPAQAAGRRTRKPVQPLGGVVTRRTSARQVASSASRATAATESSNSTPRGRATRQAGPRTRATPAAAAEGDAAAGTTPQRASGRGTWKRKKSDAEELSTSEPEMEHDDSDSDPVWVPDATAGSKGAPSTDADSPTAANDGAEPVTKVARRGKPAKATKAKAGARKGAATAGKKPNGASKSEAGGGGGAAKGGRRSTARKTEPVPSIDLGSSVASPDSLQLKVELPNESEEWQTPVRGAIKRLQRSVRWRLPGEGARVRVHMSTKAMMALLWKAHTGGGESRAAAIECEGGAGSAYAVVAHDGPIPPKPPLLRKTGAPTRPRRRHCFQLRREGHQPFGSVGLSARDCFCAELIRRADETTARRQRCVQGGLAGGVKRDYTRRPVTNASTWRTPVPVVVTEPSAASTGELQPGDYIIAVADVHRSRPPIWRIEGRSLLQRFEALETGEDTILYRNSSSFSAWNPLEQSKYANISVRVHSNSRSATVVEVLEIHASPNSSLAKNGGTEARSAACGDQQPNLEEKFEVYLQTLLSHVLDPNFLAEVHRENDEYFLANLADGGR
ncbi:hypothetical protein HPB51_002951 [Rhipicephalus microplus]|uniref:Uncharacterized protein n=1 Tax=Rhipicephalus microplus TaxID=6941 RepID=A0A9J6DS76_RHIMP|nr:hypothetical protein HPB51_002951 [Rhipicephalus microplus]